MGHWGRVLHDASISHVLSGQSSSNIEAASAASSIPYTCDFSRCLSAYVSWKAATMVDHPMGPATWARYVSAMQHVSLPVTMLYDLLTSSIRMPHHLKEHQAQRVDSSWIVPGKRRIAFQEQGGRKH